MDKVERLQHQLHVKTKGFQVKAERAKAIIADALALNCRWYAAYSSGIDSLCLLDMLFSSGFVGDTLWGDDGFDFSQSLQFLKDTEERYGFSLRRVRSLDPWRAWCEEMGRPDLCDDPEALAAWGNPHNWHDTWHTLTRDAGPRGGYGGVFLGMLASESRTRGYALKGGTRPLYQVKSEGGMWHCSPLASVTKRDVWAYVVRRDIPYNPVYDKLAALGVPLEYRRVAPLTCYRVMQYGSVVQFRQIDNALWNRMTELFPKMREYS